MEFILQYLRFFWAKIIKKSAGAAVRNSHIHKTSKVEAGSQVVNSTIRKYSFCGYSCDIANTDIGAFCSIANGVVIGGGMHPIDWVSTSPVFYQGRDSVKKKFAEHRRPSIKRVSIGHDVWIGQNALIKQGVEIGTGAVVGMGSVVTKNVLPYEVVAGNPAKKIRNRFDQEIINRLLNSKWWDLSDEELEVVGRYAKEPEIFLKELGL